MRRHLYPLLLLLLALPGPCAVRAQDLPRGQLVEKVVTRGNESQSYALYLPTAYRPDRKWPILYVFDARANGVEAARRFLAGAERYGYIVASSNNSASDGPMEPNIVSIRAMWPDTHSRFA